ncbi:MAG TPA: DUF4126 domain-containing protein [Candidatus Paceibacterota bacterium]|nr:DUF4126 domain-containing protein [Verrucomicrobiota bacterium]HRY47827.1 DUF4126 domain-containing protein [Candidatus Paceibacterota bacterium]HSA00418.1 DUF4126 domain-containing protein [Candidatus Paceibacterota bacterium]
METFLSVLAGLGLSAACGFRVFVPLFVVSLAALTGHLELAQGFEWIGTLPAVIAFGTATVLEVTAYFVPWVDHILDTMATPSAVVAGTILTAAMIQDMSPFLRWTVALIAGGGISGTVQGLTVAARGFSSAITGGLGNPLLATAEATGAVGASVMSLVFPGLFLSIILVLAIFFFCRTRQCPAQPSLSP